MSRPQLIIFSSLVLISVVLLALGEQVDFIIAPKLSQILLYPVKLVSQQREFLIVSRTRIEELEIDVQELKLTNEELKNRLGADTLDYKDPRFKMLKAVVIGRDPLAFNGYLYIDKGSRDGVYVNQPVLLNNSLVGKVKQAGHNTSIVETIEKQGFSISAVNIRSGVHGIAKQRDDLILDYIKIADEVKIGDSIATSGMSEIFPKGILIGTVKEIELTDDLLFKNVRLEPGVQINRLSYVYLVFNTEPTEEEEVKIKKSFMPERLHKLKLVIPDFRQ